MFVLNASKETHLSIGFMINGMTPRPMAVVVHFLTGPGSLVARSSVKRESLHILLIVNPGMITDANPCHRNGITHCMHDFLPTGLFIFPIQLQKRGWEGKPNEKRNLYVV